jgi:hypothetical protein
LAAHEPERTWATRAGQVLERTGGHTRAALCLDWLHVAHQTATPDWATLLAASVLGRYGTVVSLAAPNDAVCLAPAAPARFLAAVTLGRATVMLTDVDDPHEVIDMLLGIALDPVRRDALVTHANGQLDLWRSGQVRHAAPG